MKTYFHEVLAGQEKLVLYSIVQYSHGGGGGGGAQAPPVFWTGGAQGAPRNCTSTYRSLTMKT